MNSGEADESPTGVKEVAKLDLSQYRTGPLVERLVEVISLPLALLRVVLTMVVLAIAMPIACYLVLPMEDFSTMMSAGAYLYSIVFGFVLGLLLGIVRVVAIAMRSVEEVLNIILQLTAQAAGDYEHLQSGSKRMPSGGELMQQVYDEVALPAMEKAAGKAFSFLGAPIFWVYRRTLGSAVRFVITSVAGKESDEQENDKISTAAESGLAAVAKYSDRIQRFTSAASGIVSGISRRIRVVAMTPLYVIFTGFVLIGTVPLVVMWYFSGD